MRQLSIVCLIIFTLITPIFATDYHLVSDLGASAEMIGLGNVEGFSKSAASILENPAGLYRIGSISVSAFYSQIMLDFDYLNICIAVDTAFGKFGFGTMSLEVDDIPLTGLNDYDEFEVVDTFGYANRVSKLSWQISLLSSLHLGVNLSIFDNKIYNYSGFGTNMDVGIIWQIAKDTEFSFSIKNTLAPFDQAYTLLTSPEQGEKSLIENLGLIRYTNSDDSSYEGYESIPMQFVTGLRYQFWDFDFYGQLKSIPSRQMNLRSVGINYSPFFAKSLSLSAGYMDIPLLSGTDSSLTLGVGVDLGIIKINYAYETGDSFYYEGNASHYVSMGLNLGATTK